MKKLMCCCAMVLLLSGCEKPDPAEAEAYVHGDRTIHDWLEMVRDEDEDVVSAAFEGLATIGPEAKEAVPALAKALEKDESAMVRMAAVHRAARSGDKIVFDETENGLRDVLGPSLAAHQRRLDGFHAFLFGQIRRQQHGAGQHAVDADVRVARPQFHGQAARQGGD